MARAGFTAISSGQITFGRDGRWYCDGEPITNRAICDLYSRTLIVAPDGTARLELGEDRASVRIEDTPWVVTQVDGDPGTGFAVVLNDGSREPLDPTTLSTSCRAHPLLPGEGWSRGALPPTSVLRPRSLRRGGSRRGVRPAARGPPLRVARAGRLRTDRACRPGGA